MTWVPSGNLDPISLLLSWAEKLSYEGPDGRRGCVFTTQAFDPPESWKRILCWHNLEVPMSIDRHEKVAKPRLAWSPWGTKSGPNFQFFRLLDDFPRLHDDRWLLMLEPDTEPYGDCVQTQVHKLIGQHSEAWMIGGQPHPALRPQLARDLWQHLNGAALYRVDSVNFAKFRTRVWIPSLLTVIKKSPTFAFDCLTDSKVHLHLSMSLQEAWSLFGKHFVPTAGIINVSTLNLNATKVGILLKDESLVADLKEEGAVPWMLHAKGLAESRESLANILAINGMLKQSTSVAQYEDAWGLLVDPLAAVSAASDRTVAFLHLPKTGGTTLLHAMRGAPDWTSTILPPSIQRAIRCDCGEIGCVNEVQRERLRQLPRGIPGVTNFFIKLPHETYEAVEWLNTRIAAQGGSLSETLIAVRPVRERLVSMFRDYWTRVSDAENTASGKKTFTPHVERKLRAYLNDSKHYRRAGGQIDGRAWFTAFAQHGAGVPFFLSEVFGSSTHLASEISSGRLVPLPTLDLDAKIREMTGVPQVERKRVSRPRDADAVEAALLNATNLIDSIAERDAGFDEVLAEYLGDRWRSPESS